MNRPELKILKKPRHIRDYPVGPSFDAGFLTSENSGWRSLRPVVEVEKCVGCWHCYLCCPEGTVFKSGRVVDIDYAFCKGCGVCARACPKEAISMIRENE
jgi:pyruvate ferredoxin oxidoreductase delta subunit